MDPMDRIWSEADQEFRSALAALAKRGAVEDPGAVTPESLVSALEGHGWRARFGLPDPRGEGGRYAYALRDLPRELGGRHGIYRRGETDVVALTLILAGALEFEDLLAMPLETRSGRHDGVNGAEPANGSALPTHRFPSGGERTVAILALEPPALATEHKIGFREGFDDLDVVRYAWVETPNGTPVLLVKHLRAPYPGTEVHTDFEVDASELTCQVLQRLGLTDDALLWQTDLPRVLLERQGAL